MTVFIILLALGACVVFPLYCALVVASREDDRCEKRNDSPEKRDTDEQNRDDPPKSADETGAAAYYYLPEPDYTGKPWWELPPHSRFNNSDNDRKYFEMEIFNNGKE